MKIKCDYCGNLIDDTNEKCPQCGSVNKKVKRTANGAPTTMEGLERFANERGLPLKKMRFFIGEDFRGPRAYGIYKDILSGDYIVYKNHSDASRSVRYKGPDEAYAVNELYQKLKSEVNNQLAKNPKIQGKNAKSKAGTSDSRSGSKGTDKYRQKAGNVNRTRNLSRYYTWVNIKNKVKDIFSLIGDIFSVIMVLGPVVIPVFIFIATFAARLVDGVTDYYKDDGYYEYQGDAYVSYHGKWYEYVDDVWEICDIADDIDFQDNYKEHFLSKSYSYSYDFSDFKKSEIYSENYGSSSSGGSDSSWLNWSDDDDDYSWSSGWSSNWSSNWNDDGWDYDWSDWDTGYSDWDSDW